LPLRGAGVDTNVEAKLLGLSDTGGQPLLVGGSAGAPVGRTTLNIEPVDKN